MLSALPNTEHTSACVAATAVACTYGVSHTEKECTDGPGANTELRLSYSAAGGVHGPSLSEDLSWRVWRLKAAWNWLIQEGGRLYLEDWLR